MDLPSTRLVVVDVEDPRIYIAIPTYDVERMVIQRVAGDHISHLDPHFVLTRLGDGLQILGQAEVAFRKWSKLGQLTVLVSTRSVDRACFDNVLAVRFGMQTR